MMSDSYFDQIPTWKEDGACFEILTDQISGRIPVTKIEHWQDFTQLLEHPFFKQLKTQLIFRGHRRYDWGLTPSLGRLNPTNIVTEELAEKQLDLFRKAVRGRLPDNTLLDEGEEDELWSVGQHHGLKTPLLDWTHSPYVALFFAFEVEDPKDEIDNQYRAIYVINKSFIADDNKVPDIRVLEPRKDYHGRLVNQAGLFLFAPYDATIENKLINILSADEFDELKEVDENEEASVIAKYICKIYIKNEDRENCLKHLRRMNVHHASLFPDLIGASDYCNILIEEDQRQHLIAEAGKKSEEKPKEDLKVLVSSEVEVTDEIKIKTDDNLISVLKEPAESAGVEPGRIQLIAEELTSELAKNKAIDWGSRDNIQARLRNVMRIILRKYGYPISAREAIVEKILDIALKESSD